MAAQVGQLVMAAIQVFLLLSCLHCLLVGVGVAQLEQAWVFLESLVVSRSPHPPHLVHHDQNV